MRFPPHLISSVAAALVTRSLALPSSSPTHTNARRDTAADPAHGPVDLQANRSGAVAPGPGLPITFRNEASQPMCAFVVGREPATGNVVFLDGASSTWFTPGASASAQSFGCDSRLAVRIDAGAARAVALPGELRSGRVWVGQGLTFGVVPGGGLAEPSPADPGATWQIVELDYSGGKVWADLSYIDQIGVPLGLSVTAADGATLASPGLPAGAKETICGYLDAAGPGWGSLCVKRADGSVARVLPPGFSGELATLYEPYVDEVWARFQNEPLTINTQQSPDGPLVTCQVRGGPSGPLVCTHPDGAAFSYPRPTTSDILSCAAGPFARQSDDDLHVRTVARLCAAFHRATLLLDGGELTPNPAVASDQYYSSTAVGVGSVGGGGGVPVNHFAKALHDTLIKGEKGSGAYAFPMDDINAAGTGENASGMLAVDAGASMEIVIREP